MGVWIAAFIVALPIVCWGLLGFVFRSLFLALWHEPVFRIPVLIFESDDWGPGDTFHAQRLQCLADTLSRYKDSRGHHPVATLGMVLAIPDKQRMQQQAGKRYMALLITDERFADIRRVIQQGVSRGIFAIQLHGMEHYWPPALMAAAVKDDAVASWLNDEFPRTESLPPPLQSRWIDAAVLPSRPHAWEQIAPAVQEETRLFSRAFDSDPAVVVPPTFVWSRDVERAWANSGVRVIVTPGRRFEGRDARGALISSGPIIRNGMQGADGIVYVVRDDYFEPAKGHRAERAWASLEVKTRCGRPTLLEMHRFNFIDDPAVAKRSCEEVARAVEGALQRYPSLVFMSTEALARAMLDKQPSIIETGKGARLHSWCWRVREEAQMWRAARLTGLAWLIALLQRCTSAAGSTSMKTAK